MYRIDANPIEHITKLDTVKAHPDLTFNIVLLKSFELTITLVPAALANDHP